MRKNKLYFLLAILTVIFLFGTAAICSQCSQNGEPPGEEPPGTEPVVTPPDEKPPEEPPSAEKSAPTIKLSIQEGYPKYSEESGICYYRVEAEVTGSPTPDVVFSQDDSESAWGDYIAQVNITSGDEVIVLTATATNTEGSDDASIELSWGCEEPEPGPEPEPEPEVTEVETTIVADESLCGYIIGNEVEDAIVITSSELVFVGDYTNDKYIKGYLTFNIGDLSDLEYIIIKEAEIRIPEIGHENKPWWDGSEMNIKVFDYGSSLVPDDFRCGGVTVKVFSTSETLTSLTFSTNELKDELESYISSGKELFQLKFGLNGRDINTIMDCYVIFESNASLYVKYDTIE